MLSAQALISLNFDPQFLPSATHVKVLDTELFDYVKEYFYADDKRVLVIVYDNMSTLVLFYARGCYHRSSLEGPAYIYSDASGKVRTEIYYENGKVHRPYTEGPAKIDYREDGSIRYSAYYENDLLHRPVEEGPASDDFENWTSYFERGVCLGNSKEEALYRRTTDLISSCRKGIRNTKRGYFSKTKRKL